MNPGIEKDIMEYGQSLPSGFVKGRKDIMSLELIVAERKTFLNRQQLIYRCSLKVDDGKQIIRFYETLSEKGAGFSSGENDFSPGFGFKVEKTSLSGSRREGNIKELSILFGKKYSYNFKYQDIRENITSIADKYNYRLDIVLSRRQLV